jgi:hypothetical protein
MDHSHVVLSDVAAAVLPDRVTRVVVVAPVTVVIIVGNIGVMPVIPHILITRVNRPISTSTYTDTSNSHESHGSDSLSNCLVHCFSLLVDLQD